MFSVIAFCIKGLAHAYPKYLRVWPIILNFTAVIAVTERVILESPNTFRLPEPY